MYNYRLILLLVSFLYLLVLFFCARVTEKKYIPTLKEDKNKTFQDQEIQGGAA